MRLCISTLVCPNWNLDRILESLTQNGIGGIDFRGLETEIDITRLPAFTTQLSRTLGELQRRNLVMPCLNTSITLITPAPERWEMMLDECQRYVHLAQRAGTKYFRVFGGAVPTPMTHGEARSLAQRRLRQLIKLAQHHDCIPLLETHDAWATSQDARELLSGFSDEEVGVLWDFEHSWRAGEPVMETAQHLCRFIRHVHIKDSIRTGANRSPRLLGDGELPLNDFLAALQSIQYQGWICLETEKRWNADAPEPEQSVPQFAHWMRENGR